MVGNFSNLAIQPNNAFFTIVGSIVKIAVPISACKRNSSTFSPYRKLIQSNLRTKLFYTSCIHLPSKQGFAMIVAFSSKTWSCGKKIQDENFGIVVKNRNDNNNYYYCISSPFLIVIS